MATPGTARNRISREDLEDKFRELEGSVRDQAESARSTVVTAGVIAALEADPNLNRGQRETIRMMYDQFTRGVGKR